MAGLPILGIRAKNAFRQILIYKDGRVLPPCNLRDDVGGPARKTAFLQIFIIFFQDCIPTDLHFAASGRY